MRSILALAFAAVLAPVAVRADTVTEERIVPEDRVGQDVEIRDVRAHDDGTVTGTIVNRSQARLRDVRLMVRYLWLWDNEFHPGNDDRSRADYVSVPDEIPPGGRGEFTYRPATPIAGGRGGHFETDVRVASVVEVTGGPASPSPTAGTGAGVDMGRQPQAPIEQR
jgi:hypothetical protein